MAIRAVVFDIGGVLEITQDLSPTRSQDSITRSWEARLGLPAGEIDVQAGEAVFVDDYVPNVTAASEAGLHAVHFTGNATVIGEIERLLGQP